MALTANATFTTTAIARVFSSEFVPVLAVSFVPITSSHGSDADGILHVFFLRSEI
jgi:hypothetical protein